MRVWRRVQRVSGGPSGRRSAAEAGLGFGEADLGVAVLEFFDDLGRHGAAAGDLLKILGHLAELVGRAVGEQENCGALAHGFSTHLLAARGCCGAWRGRIA